MSGRAQLLRMVDSDGNGVIDYYEFAEQVGGMRRATAASKSLAKKAADMDSTCEPSLPNAGSSFVARGSEEGRG